MAIGTFEFTLKQHSPILHFQSVQTGSTLRATEMKAKLDRFLIEKILNENDRRDPLPALKAHNVYKNCLVGGPRRAQHPAFDYKIVLVDADPSPRTGSTPIITVNDVGQWKFSQHGIRVLIQTFHQPLIQLIRQYYREFFALTNFGKRQSKGWGSYYPDDRQDDFLQQLRDSGRAVFQWTSSLSESEIGGDAFYAKIKDAWRLLKSGKNRPYKKAETFFYANRKNIRWDKRLAKHDITALIKSGHLTYALKEDHPPIDNHTDLRNPYFDWEDNPEIDAEYRFVRAMLGLPELYEFQTENRSHKHQVKFASGEVDKIERFKSPVTFKVYGRNIYAIAETIPDAFFGAQFNATVETKNGTGETIVGPFNMPSVYLTPSQTEFNLINFLDEHFKKVDFNRL